MALTTVKTSALTGDINLTSQVTGTLPTGNGGTGATSFAPGKIGQVISQTLAPCQTSTTGTSYVATSFSIDITPTATSSKIYVTFNCGGVYHSTSNGGLIRIRYNSDTTIFSTGGYTCYQGSSDMQIGSSCAVLHSPNTTSQKNYKIEIANRQTNGEFYIGHPNTSDTYGTLTCMEVLA
jgi:hypothetical protein